MTPAHHSILVTAGIAACLCAAGAQTPRPAGFARQTGSLRKRLAALLRKTSASRAGLEEVRRRCRREEREGEPSWRKAWAATDRERRRLHRSFARLLDSWRAEVGRDLGDKAPSPGRRKELRAAWRGVLTEWVRAGEPDRILAALRGGVGRLASVLAREDDAGVRLKLVGRIADRLVATPGKSDLDILCSVADWLSLFHADQPAGKVQLGRVTADLVLVCTDRGRDGLTRSGAGFYRAGRFTDRGFKEALRDGSDQVRHFAWALRLLAISTNQGRTMDLLRLKELRDSLLRNEPVDKADLALNRAARRVVAAILSSPPVAAAGYSRVIRRELGR